MSGLHTGPSGYMASNNEGLRGLVTPLVTPTGEKRPRKAASEPLSRARLDLARQTDAAAARLPATPAVETLVAVGALRASDHPVGPRSTSRAAIGRDFRPAPGCSPGLWAISPLGCEEGRSAAGRCGAPGLRVEAVRKGAHER
jgi:hypothetical protein